MTTSNLILDEDERLASIARAPEINQWLRPYVGGDELISGVWRWCLWLKDAPPKAFGQSQEVKKRLDRVRAGRLQSPTASVREFANYPWLFTQDRQPNTEYLAIPEVSSETRDYIPIALLPPEVIGSNKLLLVPVSEPWLFALITSAMHMGWMRTVTGRLESRYSYAPTVYNSFPWPDLPEDAKKKLNASAKAILDARSAQKGQTLEDLYAPSRMPPALRKAHLANDKLVDSLFQKGGFSSERARVEFLFKLFEKRASPIEAAAQPEKQSKRRKKAATD